MVDSIVTFAIENLSRLLVDEVKLLSGVEDEIKSLSNELKFMDIFLKSSEGKRNDDMVKQVASQIIDLANQAEDVVDTYIANVSKHRSRNMLGKCFHCKGRVLMLHEVDGQIKNIKVKIDEIYKNKAKYGIGEGDFTSEGNNEKEVAESLRNRRRFVEEEEVVGLVHDSSIVSEHLMKGDPRLRVVSIIGMGGLGKTTLARKIYNKDEVTGTFPYRAWGFVSNDYRAKELLSSLLQCLKPLAYNVDLNVEQLKEKVKECLKGNKYLVVLDDIWKTQVWDEIQGVFPNDHNGSRILITSRERVIASHMRTTFDYDLPLLNESQSWELFFKKVFCGEKCPPELEDLGRAMAKSCKGLPLAITVLAGLVAKKDKSQREWSRIKDHANWYLTLEGNTQVINILKLSYDNLPRRLKPCFLYLGIYPEDYEINVRQMIQLWVAEGFIQPKEIGTSNAPEPEDVADYYLDELVDRSLVQVASRRSDGGVKTCRIHDLLRDLCISESKENKFLEVCTELDLDQCNPRRLSVNYKTKFFPTKYNQSLTRSLFLFGGQLDRYESTHMKFIRKSFKLARVLDFGPVPLISPPNGMIHLRYLKMRLPFGSSASTRNILAPICSLWNLETLHLEWDAERRIKMTKWVVDFGMSKLKRLKHVQIKMEYSPFWMDLSIRLPNKIMRNLQTLCGVAIDPKIAYLLNNGCFPNLKKLSIRITGNSSHEQLPCLSRLSNLRTLRIVGHYDLPVDANVFPSSLTKITCISFGEMDSITMNTLGRLANLQILKLIDSCLPKSLHCADGEFPQLRVFKLWDSRVMPSTGNPSWRLEEGAMPRLRSLLLSDCLWIPKELLSLTTLRLVHVVHNDPESIDSLHNFELNRDCKVIIDSCWRGISRTVRPPPSPSEGTRS